MPRDGHVLAAWPSPLHSPPLPGVPPLDRLLVGRPGPPPRETAGVRRVWAVAWERVDDSTTQPEVRLEESVMTVFRPGVELLRRRPPTVPELIDALIHDWCERPHDICVCQDNPLRRPAVAAVHREKQERQRRAAREAA